MLLATELINKTSTQKVAEAMGLPYSKEVNLDYVGISDEEVQENYRRIYASYGLDTVEEFIRRSYDDTLQVFRSGNV
ncbi:HAD family phosphatase, partial [Enterococcus faecalis]